MFCQTCGSAISQSLSYCNRCGTRISNELAKPEQQFPESLVWAIVSGFVAGIGVIIGLMAVMKNVVGFPHALILALSFLSFFVLFAIEGVLISMLISTRRRQKELAEPTQLPSRTTMELNEARQEMINEPVASVTDGTTRTLKPVYTEHKSD